MIKEDLWLPRLENTDLQAQFRIEINSINEIERVFRKGISLFFFLNRLILTNFSNRIEMVKFARQCSIAIVLLPNLLLLLRKGICRFRDSCCKISFNGVSSIKQQGQLKSVGLGTLRSCRST